MLPSTVSASTASLLWQPLHGGPLLSSSEVDPLPARSMQTLLPTDEALSAKMSGDAMLP